MDGGFTLKPSRGIATLGSNRHVPMHKFDKSALSTDALYNFRTAFSDHDEKTALYLNDILNFDSIIALLVAEHILSSKT